MLNALLLALAMTASPAGTCSISDDERDELLSLEWETFDQTPHEGWRRYGEDRWDEPGCQRLAAELIEAYLAENIDLKAGERRVSSFHAGQLFAFSADNNNALKHFYRSFNANEPAESDGRWNAYVRATIAFLEGDQHTLVASRRVLEDHLSSRMNRINLRLVRAFEAKIGASYSEALQFATTLPDVTDPSE